jgi:transposase
MFAEPRLSNIEWRVIRALLPRPRTGRPRVDDRRDIARLLYAKVRDEPLQSLFGRRISARLIVKRARWREAGVWNAIEAAGQPAIERMRAQKLRALARHPLVKLGLVVVAF